MIPFGWLQEWMNPPGRTTTTIMPFWFGTITGIAPWIAIAAQIIGSKTVPGFFYGIVIVQSVLFHGWSMFFTTKGSICSAMGKDPQRRRPTGKPDRSA